MGSVFSRAEATSNGDAGLSEEVKVTEPSATLKKQRKSEQKKSNNMDSRKKLTESIDMDGLTESMKNLKVNNEFVDVPIALLTQKYQELLKYTLILDVCDELNNQGVDFYCKGKKVPQSEVQRQIMCLAYNVKNNLRQISDIQNNNEKVRNLMVEEALEHFKL